MQGFNTLLEQIKSRILSGEFKKVFDNQYLDTGNACRILNDHPVDMLLAQKLIEDLPLEIFDEPYLDMMALADATDPRHAKMSDRKGQIENILKPFLDEITYRLSLTLLDPTRTRLNDRTQAALATDFNKLTIDKDQLVVGLYSSVIALFSQAIVDAQNEAIGIKRSSHGSTTRLSDLDHAKTQHLSAIQHIIQTYQSQLDLEKIKDISPEPKKLIELAEECIDKGLTDQAIMSYKIAHEKDPEQLPNVGDALVNYSLNKLSEIAVEESYFPLSESYKTLNKKLREILTAKAKYETSHDDESFKAMMENIDDCIKRFDDASETKKTVWEGKIIPAFKSLIAGIILLVLSIPVYLLTPPKHRKAIVDSFLKQDKDLKERMIDFKSRIQAVKKLGESPKEQENKKGIDPLEIDQGSGSYPKLGS